MKNEMPGVECFFKAIFCVRKRSVLLIAAPLLLIPTMVLAGDGAIRFHGQVTHPTCAVLQSSTVTPGQATHYVKVSAQLTVRIQAALNSCDQQTLPFSTSFTLLPVSEVRVSRSEIPGVAGRLGVLTMSYE